MNLNFRIAHWLTMVSFPVLVVTGFALKFPEAWWARPMLVWETHFALPRACASRGGGRAIVFARLSHSASCARAA